MSFKIKLEHTVEEIEHLFKAMESHAKAHNALMNSVKQQAEAQLAAANTAPVVPSVDSTGVSPAAVPPVDANVSPAVEPTAPTASV
jgi:hypothetical protein